MTALVIFDFFDMGMGMGVAERCRHVVYANQLWVLWLAIGPGVGKGAWGGLVVTEDAFFPSVDIGDDGCCDEEEHSKEELRSE